MESKGTQADDQENVNTNTAHKDVDLDDNKNAPDQENTYVNTAYDNVDLDDDDKAGDVEDHGKTNGIINEMVDDVEHDDDYDNPKCGWFGIRPGFIQVIILMVTIRARLHKLSIGVTLPSPITSLETLL